MKLSFLLPFLMSTQLYALSSYSQATKIQLNHVEEIPLSALIEEIEKQTDYLFIYSKNDVVLSKKVKVSTKDELLTKVLDAAFIPLNIQYEISNNYILLKKSEKAQVVQQQTARPIKGKVLDGQGQVLIGVVVNVKGTANSVISNVH